MEHTSIPDIIHQGFRQDIEYVSLVVMWLFSFLLSFCIQRFQRPMATIWSFPSTPPGASPSAPIRSNFLQAVEFSPAISSAINHLYPTSLCCCPSSVHFPSNTDSSTGLLHHGSQTNRHLQWEWTPMASPRRPSVLPELDLVSTGRGQDLGVSFQC